MKEEYELFDHTADIGIRARGSQLSDLVRPSVEGLYAVIGELCAVGPQEEEEIILSGESPDLLLRDFLAELLFRFEDSATIATQIDVVEFTAERLAVRVTFSGVDFEESVLEREVKAVTYHELSVRNLGDSFEATLIVDI